MSSLVSQVPLMVAEITLGTRICKKYLFTRYLIGEIISIKATWGEYGLLFMT